MKSRVRTLSWVLGIGFFAAGCLLAASFLMAAADRSDAEIAPADISWQRLSTTTGDLQPPSASVQQVLSLVLDVDNDGDNDFVIGARNTPGPSLVWYRRDAAGWTHLVIETDVLMMEAGGAFHDIDEDGDLDLVAGSNNRTNQIWWWENPYPNYVVGTDWARRFIKNSGANKHHDLMFGNFDDDAGVEFVFWNQGAAALAIVDVPADPRQTQPWPNQSVIWNAPSGQYEGLAAADVNEDGKSDIIGGGRWFEHTGGTAYTPRLIENTVFARVAAAQLIPGGRPEIVQVPGDGDGIGRWFEWDGVTWIGRDLPLGVISHGHSLEIADIDEDGHLDVFVAEMRKVNNTAPQNPDARLAFLLGDSAGNFTPHTVATGYGNHESRVADLDGDGDLDILGKPFLWETPRLDIWLNSLRGAPAVCEPLGQWRTHLIDDARPRRAVFVETADLDNDSLPDVIAGAWWYRNPGTPGGPWLRSEIGTPLNQMALVHDFDNDGDADILGTVLAGTQNQLGNAFVWAQNDGAGNFTIYDNIPAGSGNFLQGAAAGAFDGTGRQVALSWHNEAGGIEALGIPADPATDPWTLGALAPVAAGEEVSAGDIDNDGDTDLLLGTIWLENAAPWADHVLGTQPYEADRNRLADMDNDGDLDAVVGFEGISAARPVIWFERPDNPREPWPAHPIGSAIGPQSLDVGDLDSDGDLDVVVGEHNTAEPGAGRVLIFENRGNVWVQHRAATGHEHHDGTQLVDIDNDGDLDIVSIGWTHDDVVLYERVPCPETPPSRTPAPTRTATATVAATETPMATPTATPTPTLSHETAGATSYFLSSTSAGTVGGVTFADEDVLHFDASTGRWSLYFDGSDVGLASRDVDAFHLLADGTLLLSLDAPLKLPGLNTVDDSDVLRFSPTSLGDSTAGTLTLHFDGSIVGLTTNAEDVDALAMTADGGLLVSTLGGAKVSGATATDEDLLLFQPSQPGNLTAGTWSLHFDGSRVGLGETGEDVLGAALNGAGHLHLSGPAKTRYRTLAAGAADVALCALAGSGMATECSPPPSLAWRGGNHGFGSEAIDALDIVTDGPVPTPTATASPSPSATPTPTPGPCDADTIAGWRWARHVVDANRPGRAAFLFTFDINDDQRDDILTGKFWYANPGAAAGAWARTQLPAPIEDVIAAHDFDSDGDLDLLASTGATEPMDQSRWWPFVWARNEGGGLFTVFDNLDVSGIDMPVNDPIQGVAIARFNPDGPLQVAVTWDDTERPLRNPYGVQMFTVPAEPATQTWPRQKISDVSTGEQLSAADLDSDSDLDVFMGNIWLRNNYPSPDWTPITIFTLSSGQSSRHELANIDGDGDLDAFVGYSHDTDGRRMTWHERPTSAESVWPFHLIANLNTGYAESLDATDLDGDGDADVIVGEYNMRSAVEYPASLWIFENTGDGASWAQHLVYYGDSHYQSSQAFDIDSDGDLDILSKGWHHTRVHLYENLKCGP